VTAPAPAPPGVPPAVQAVFVTIVTVVVLGLGLQWLTTGDERCGRVYVGQLREGAPVYTPETITEVERRLAVGDQWPNSNERVTRVPEEIGDWQMVCHEQPGFFTR
jgi:hypothetical protein